VFREGPERARFVWTTDLLPDELAVRTAQLMEHGLSAIKATLNARARPVEEPGSIRAALMAARTDYGG
jgi:hypothetical protein